MLGGSMLLGEIRCLVPAKAVGVVALLLVIYTSPSNSFSASEKNEREYTEMVWDIYKEG